MAVGNSVNPKVSYEGHSWSCRGFWRRWMKMRLHRVLGIVLTGLSFTHGLMADQQQALSQEVPTNQARLSLQVPQETQAWLDGRKHDVAKTFAWNGLSPETPKYAQLKLKFPSGVEESHTLVLTGGNHLRFARLDPAKPKPELVPQLGHKEGITTLAVSPAGKFVLTGSGDNTAILWDAETGQRIRSFQPNLFPNAAVTSVAFSPDGTQALLGSAECVATLWDVRTGERLGIFQGHRDWIRSVAFSSPDGRQILTASDDGTAILWEKDSQQPLRTFAKHSAQVAAASFSPDGRHVLTSSHDSTAILWDVETSEALRVFEGHTGPVTHNSFSPDGTKVLTGSADKTARMWEVNTGALLETFETSEFATFHPDGSSVLTCNGNRAILWDIETAQATQTISESAAIFAAAFNPDGRWLVSCTWENPHVSRWDSVTGERLNEFKTESVDLPVSVALSPDDQRLFIGCQSGQALLWDFDNRAPVRALQSHEDAIRAACFSPDGRFVATGSMDSKAKIWDVETGFVRHTLGGHTDRLTSVDFSPDGKWLVTAATDQHAAVWSISTGKLIRVLRGHTNWVTSATFSPNGRWILTSSLDGTTILWDAATGRRLRTYEAHLANVPSSRFSPDGNRIITGSWDKTAIVWETLTGRRQWTLADHQGVLDEAFWDPAGTKLLTVDNKTPILWDASNRTRIRAFEGHGEAVTSSVFSSDGQKLITCSGDATIRLWDVPTGQELLRLMCLDRGAAWLASTPEGFFDGSSEAREKIAFRLGEDMKIVPVDRFFQDFYRPGLIQELVAGERPLPTISLGGQRPPRIEIQTADRQVVRDPQLTLEIKLTDQGGGIQAPRLYHNGTRRLLAGQSPQREGNHLVWRPTVSLAPGSNTFEVRSATEDGEWESEPARVTLRFAGADSQPRLFLLAVGVNRYQEESFNLQFARADAEALTKLFQERAEQLYGQGNVVTRTLVDEDATRSNIQQALVEIAETARSEDVFLLHLSGHGYTVGQRYYFIPHEFQKNDTQSIEENVAREGLPNDVLGDWIAQIPATKRIQILDTCQAGGAIALTRSRDAFAFQKTLESIARRQGSHVIAAAPADDQAQEITDLEHGVLTYALLAALGEVQHGPLASQPLALQDDQPLVPVGRWLDYAQEHVPTLTKQYLGKEQFVRVQKDGRDFKLLPQSKDYVSDQVLSPNEPGEPADPAPSLGETPSRVAR